MIPRVLRNFSAFVNGLDYAGRVTELELPDLKIKTEEHRGGGMDGPAEIDMGMEALTSKLTFAEYLPDVLKAFGKLGTGQRVLFRGGLQRDQEAVVPVVVEMHGGFKSSTMGTWKAGEVATHEVEATLRYYKLEIGDETIYEIDIDNMVRFIDGVDVLAGIRAAISG
jgi:P2 family phage contractile tail tube protein